MAGFGWDYPPGVTGNEPQISGIYPAEQVIDEALANLRHARSKIEDTFAGLEDQGVKFTKIEVNMQDKLLQLIDEVGDDIAGRMPEEY